MISPGATLGVLGGGQLGRMLALAAARLGLNVAVYSDEPDAPACRVAAHATVGSYSDCAAVAEFASRCDVVTYEFENVPADTAQRLEAAGVLVRPGSQALAVSQDRLLEKQFLRRLGAETAPFAAVEGEASLAAAIETVGLPAILKTRRLGYDGRGQARLQGPEDAAAAWNAIGRAPAILEGFCPFVREVSVIAARGSDGGFAAYDLSENLHESGILAYARAPAASSSQTASAAEALARRLAEGLGYVGVFAIEFFELPDGALWANEWAPRVHNSGHWTADACLTGQFEQHVRAVCGWPLGDPRRLYAAEMRNLMGSDAEDWAQLAADPDARLWLYGKREAREGRKMGHVTRLFSNT